ncbi:MAG: FtsW/RodA/SpoVE family cell cycle protein [Lachnospiraceae bacterium]
MSRRSRVRKKYKNRHSGTRRRRYYDYNLVFLTLFLVVLGLIMIFSATQGSGDFFEKQALFAVIGTVCMIGVSFIPYRIYKIFTMPLVILSALMFLLIFTPLGHSSHGATRWINLGFTTLQPAEIAKIAIIFFVALVVSRVDQKRIRLWKSWALIFGVAFVFVCEIFFITDNLSSAIIVFGIAFVMFFVANPDYKIFAALAGGGAALVTGLVLLIVNLSSGEGSFRFARILAWLDPEQYMQDGGYQLLNGLYAIGSGGLFGKGLGASAQKAILPEVQNDMIFAIICEELGLFGAFVIILLFILLLYRMVYIARHAKDLFGSMLVIGVFAHIAIQVILNIAVVTNSIPNTGISLPFISAGGTSLLLLMLEVGVVLNVSRSIEYE